ncbi:MAG: hypothetical protein QOI91_486 [Solirubrobacteraceae bacterium]|nr:hypothetical protein [Solirubrobacteraceae bacterium]
MSRRSIAVAVVLVLALGAAGCGDRQNLRTGRVTLQRAMTKAFKRAFAAEHRLRTGKADRGIALGVRSRCKRQGRQPKSEATPWRWTCQVLWRTRGRGPRFDVVTYGVRVDRLGCFTARSGDFPPRVRDRLLGGTARNPLVSVRSCP